MSYEFKLTRSVEFSETDMAGIMHFSNFFRFMEAAEHAFFRSLGLSVVLSRCGLGLQLPRVHAECDYQAPVRFEDEILIHLLLQKKGRRSLTYLFRFYRKSGSLRQQVARGQLVVVCAELGPNGLMKAVPLHNKVADKLQEAPAHLLADTTVGPVSSGGKVSPQAQKNGGSARRSGMRRTHGAPRSSSRTHSARKT